MNDRPADDIDDWAEPGFADLTWDLDDMHLPRVLTRLGEEYVQVLAAGGGYRSRKVGLPIRLLVHVRHGRAYFAQSIDAPQEDHAAVREAALAQRRAEFDLVGGYWMERALPELRAAYIELDGLPPANAGPADLVAAWDRGWAIAARAWDVHFYVISAPYQVLEDLVDLVEARVPGIAAGAILALASGQIEELRRVDTGLDELAAVAAGAAAVASRLRTGPSPTLAEIRAEDGGDAFADRVEAFLAEHGHLGHVSEDLAEPSWLDDPRPLLGDIGARLGRDSDSVAARRVAMAAEAEKLVERIRASLAEPADLAEFDRLLATARRIGPLTEGHNYWIDRMCGARMRRFTRRIGAVLVERGVIADPEDIRHLARGEVRQLLLDPRDRRTLVVERVAGHARWSDMTPPRTIGRPPAADREVDRFDGARFDSIDAGTLRGTGASAGTVRAVARVVTGPADFDRVGPGEIVVARASNPGWVPLFGLAGGFVTDTGGVLSHAAVVAREFGLPAVVGTGDATSRIADGQVIEIDGATGLVRLE